MKRLKKRNRPAASVAPRQSHRSPPSADAVEAKLAVAEYCLFHYPTLFTAGVPSSSTWQGTAAWAVPIVLTHPQKGVIGEIGEAIVDARTRQVVHSSSRAEVVARAKRLQGA